MCDRNLKKNMIYFVILVESNVFVKLVLDKKIASHMALKSGHDF